MFLMHAAKWSQKIAGAGPHTFGSVDVHLANPITIVIACPFVFTMLDGYPWALNLIVTLPFIGIGNRLGSGEARQVSLQGFAIRAFRDPQAYLSALATNAADDGRTIIRVSTMPALLVGAAAW